MAAAGEPGVQCRRVSRGQGSSQHDLGDAVFLDEDDAGHVGRGGVLASTTRTVGHVLVEPGVVIDRHEARHVRRHDREADRDHERGPEVVDVAPGDEVERDPDDERIDGDRPDPEGQHRQGDHEEGQRRPHQRFEQADDQTCDQRRGEVVEDEAVEEGREEPQRERIGDDDDAATERLAPPGAEFVVAQECCVLGHRTLELYDRAAAGRVQSP